MDKLELCKKRTALLEEKKAFEKNINEQYTEAIKAYVEKNSPMEHLKVYEIVSGGKSMKHCKRFVVYDHDVMFMDNDSPIVRVCGWWLNKDSVPVHWKTYPVLGVGNPVEFKLSENQENKPHPESKEK